MPRAGPAEDVTALIHALAATAATDEHSPSHRSKVKGALERLDSGYEALISALKNHGLTGSAYLLLESPEFRQLDAAQKVARRLRPAFLMDHARTLANLRTLERARDILTSEGITLLITQGAALLARGVYPRVEARPMVDVDGIVRGEDWDRAARVLTAAGMQPSEDGQRWIDGEGILDLHLSPLGMERIRARRLALPLTTELVWDHSGPPGSDAQVGQGLLVPSLPLLWAMGLAHVQKHSFGALMWLLDLARIAAMLSGEELAEARSWTERLRLPGACVVATQVHRRCWNLPVPRELEIDRSCLEPKTMALVEGAVRNITALRDPGLVGEQLLWRMAPDSVDRLRLIWESTFPRGKVMKEIYPGYRPLLRPWFMLRRLWDLGRRRIGTR